MLFCTLYGSCWLQVLLKLQEKKSVPFWDVEHMWNPWQRFHFSSQANIKALRHNSLIVPFNTNGNCRGSFFLFFFLYLMFVVEMKCLLSLIVYIHLWASGQSSRVPILGAPGGAQQRLFFRTFNPFWFLALNAMTKWWGAIFPRPSSSTWPMKT